MALRQRAALAVRSPDRHRRLIPVPRSRARTGSRKVPRQVPLPDAAHPSRLPQQRHRSLQLARRCPQLLRQRGHALSGVGANRPIQSFCDCGHLRGGAPLAALGRGGVPRCSPRRLASCTGCTGKRSLESFPGTPLDGANVFPNQLLDALVQISMVRGVTHAVRFTCGTPNLNSPREQLRSASWGAVVA
jgi:hypothetical protein